MSSRRARRGLVALALVAGGAACGDDAPDRAEAAPSTSDAATTTRPTTTTSASRLPPADTAELEPLYGAALADLGLRLTDRGGLFDRTGGGYVAAAGGTHLALYVEPIDDRTVPQYLDGIRALGTLFSDVFDRWPGLVSYDVCQEPVDPDGTQEEEPLPVTQIELTRAEAAAIDWETVSVIDLVHASMDEPPGLGLRVSSGLAGDPAYVAVVEEAS